jgi:hypothetical protein
MCIRDRWILNGQDGIGRSEIAALAETLERRDVKLTTPPQLRVAYMTAWPVGNTVAFRNDVYGLDGTGFTVGQPLAEGELSEEGQRFVLQPQQRKPAAVEAAEAEGFGLFGKRTGKAGVAGAKFKPRRVASLYDGDDITDASFDTQADAAPAPSKVPFAVKKKPGAKIVGVEKQTLAKKKVGTKKEFPGLFDWAAYRKDQKSKAKAPAAQVVKAKKKLDPKKAVVETAAVAPKAKIEAAKKPVATTKPVAPVAVKKSSPTPEVAKKVAAPEPKKVTTDTAKKVVPEAVKKPVVAEKKIEAAPKKVADACKADGAGVLPKGCKAPAAKKP